MIESSNIGIKPQISNVKYYQNTMLLENSIPFEPYNNHTSMMKPLDKNNSDRVWVKLNIEELKRSESRDSTCRHSVETSNHLYNASDPNAVTQNGSKFIDNVIKSRRSVCAVKSIEKVFRIPSQIDLVSQNKMSFRIHNNNSQSKIMQNF